MTEREKREKTQGYSSEKKTKQTGGPPLPYAVLHTFSLHRPHLNTHPPFRPACRLKPSQAEPEWPSNGPEEGEVPMPLVLELAHHPEVFIADQH